MKTRLPRRIGSFFAFFVLAGCAMPPGPADQASNTPLSTRSAHAGSDLSAPVAYGAAFGGPASGADAKAGDKSLADAEPLTEGGPDVSDFQQTGRASWYGPRFHGRRTASGERYNMHALTAAHRTLPMGSYVRVTNPTTTRSVIVRINDRGPYARGRVIDLSYAAALELDLQHAGTARVKIEGLSQQEARAARNEILAANSPK
ncbi:septal ring lytic transglycosylase RlpA family protein [Paraburkholderia megapolitana]|uniref:septal ring lytic transglycosylase RlpA family protein n=1 Tax=Paraburkholderia megapolitana TaxID=420953 RepID=UPI0038B9DC52